MQKKKTLILKSWDLEPECLSMPRAYCLWESRINSKWGLLSSVLLRKLYSSRETPSPTRTDSRRHCLCHWLCWLNLNSCCARQLRRCTIQTCWQRKSRTPFSLAVKWQSLITCENGIDSKEQKIRNDLLKKLMMARFGDSIELRYRYPGIFSAAVSILTGQVVEKCTDVSGKRTQAAWIGEYKSPFVLVNNPEHERRMRFHCAM